MEKRQHADRRIGRTYCTTVGRDIFGVSYAEKEVSMKPGNPFPLISILVTISLASVGGIAWAVTAQQKAVSAYQKAVEAHDLASGDHDKITKLEVIVPRIEQKIDQIINFTERSR